MSGPKISVYSLTGRARTVVVGQIRCEQQSVACASQTTEILRGLIAYSMDFRQDMANIQLLMKRVNVGAEQLEKLTRSYKRFKEKLSCRHIFCKKFLKRFVSCKRSQRSIIYQLLNQSL